MANPRDNLKPFQLGNPGRPRGSRNKLSEAFIAAMCEDFEEHGIDVIAAVRKDKPDQYLKVIASILPKELHVKDASLDDMSDDELIDILATLRSLKTEPGRGEGRKRGKAAPRSSAAGEQLN